MLIESKLTSLVGAVKKKTAVLPKFKAIIPSKTPKSDRSEYEF